MLRATLAVLLLVPALATAEGAALARARRVLAAHPVFDGHNDLPWAIREDDKAAGSVEAYDLRTRTRGHTDLARLREGGVGAQFWSVYVPGDPKRARGFARLQLEQIDIARRVVARYPDRLAWGLTAEDVEREMKRGRVASLLGIEGGHAIESSLGALRAYYDLGVRYMTLTHSVNVDWADSSSGPPVHHGLSRFGEEVVREMNRLGMLVDLSHVSPETMEDALRVSEAPVIFSHSSAHALTPAARNVPDDVLRRMSANGGLVMVTFVPSFVSLEVAKAYEARDAAMKEALEAVTDPAERRRAETEYRKAHPLPKATVAQVADHVEHVRKVAGADHVGLGGDFDGIDEGPTGLEDVSKYPHLIAELIRRGWTDADLAKLTNGNILRVLRKAEEVARRIQAARPPSTATREALDGA